jgi:hypothetical protein
MLLQLLLPVTPADGPSCLLLFLIHTFLLLLLLLLAL